MPYRLFCVALVLGLAAAGCDDSTTSPSATTSPRFTAVLSPTNDVPAIINADARAGYLEPFLSRSTPPRPGPGTSRRPPPTSS